MYGGAPGKLALEGRKRCPCWYQEEALCSISSFDESLLSITRLTKEMLNSSELLIVLAMKLSIMYTVYSKKSFLCDVFLSEEQMKDIRGQFRCS